MADEPVTPSARVAVCLASAVCHAEEGISPRGNPADWEAFKGLMADPGVQAYLARLRALALLPEPR